MPLLLVPTPAAPSAQHAQPPPRRLVAVRASGPITIDGRLDEPDWQAAPVASDFIQQYPTPGAAATERTEARVLYDADALYVGMRIYRAEARAIAGPVARRDYTGYSDWAQVLVDSYHDRRTAWRFAVNPAGVQKDVLEYDDGNGEDVNWDAVWEAAAHVDSLGWTAEFRIPFSQLRFSSNAADSAGLVWGLDFIRDDASKRERDYWAPIPPAGPGFVSWFGELDGLSGLRSPRRLELRPYALGQDTRAPGVAADPFYHVNDAASKLGMDLEYGLTANATLTGTLNPDFGQVEADPSVVNLTAFQTFFPEKRPYFLEGEQFFTFNVNLPLSVPGTNLGNDTPFYSRRIGAAPPGAVPDAAVFSQLPDATPILGAGKVSGKTATGWSFGLLDAVTARQDGRYTDSTGTQLTTPVAPLTDYAVARAIKDFRSGRSAIGGMITATDRDLPSGPLGALTSSAYAAGVDARHRFGRDTYEIDASALATELEGSPAAMTRVEEAAGHYFQRPDASYLHDDSTRTSLAGLNTTAQISKIAGRWRWTVAGLSRSPGFELNDIGFQQSADWLVGGASLAYVDYTPGRHILDWSVSANATAGWTFGGERRVTALDIPGNVLWLSNWGLSFDLNHLLPALSVDALRGGPALRTPAADQASVTVFSDARRRVSDTLTILAFHEPETGGHSVTLQSTLAVRTGSRAEFSLGPLVAWTDNPWQYVAQGPALGAVQYMFARLRQTTAALVVRASYAFTPKLTVQLYGEPFISAGRYSPFSQVVAPRAPSFADRFRPLPGSAVAYDSSTQRYNVDLNGDGVPDLSFANPDFNFRQFRSTAVLRWECFPGSALFVVWSQGRTALAPDGSFRFGRDVDALFNSAGTNVLIVKLSYWLSP